MGSLLLALIARLSRRDTTRPHWSTTASVQRPPLRLCPEVRTLATQARMWHQDGREFVEHQVAVVHHPGTGILVLDITGDGSNPLRLFLEDESLSQVL